VLRSSLVFARLDDIHKSCVNTVKLCKKQNVHNKLGFEQSNFQFYVFVLYDTEPYA